MICSVCPYTMLSYGGLKGEERQATSKQKDPDGPEDEKVVPLFGKRPRDELVPIQAPEELIGADGRGNSAWGERGTGDLIDPSAIPSIRPSRRALRIAFSGAAGAVIAAAAVVLVSGQLFSGSPPVLRATASQSRPTASALTGPASLRYDGIFRRLHRSLSQPPHVHPNHQSRRPGTRSRHAVTGARVEPVSYQPARATTSGATTTGESSSYQAPVQTAASSSQASSPTTTPSASSASRSSSASRPTQPSVTGVLTCISNCG